MIQSEETGKDDSEEWVDYFIDRCGLCNMNSGMSMVVAAIEL